MRRFFLLAALAVCLSLFSQLPMQGWRFHLAYNNVTRVEVAKDKVYALSEGALFSVDKDNEEIEYYNQLTGLSGTNIVAMGYASNLDILVLAYANGYIDLLHDNEIITIPDLYNKNLSASKEARHISIHNNKAYLSMDFGIIVVNLLKGEIADTYYIGANAETTKVLATAFSTDSIFAFTESELYCAALKDNLIDYSYWQKKKTPGIKKIMGATSFQNDICMLRDSTLHLWTGVSWEVLLPEEKIYQIRATQSQLLALSTKGTFAITTNYTFSLLSIFLKAHDAGFDPNCNEYWYAFGGGINRWYTNESKYNKYLPVGPLTNTAYRLRFVGERLYVVPGGYLGIPYATLASLMWYENNEWTNITTQDIQTDLGFDVVWNWCDVMANPLDPTHFYVASYGNGLIEYKNDTFYKWYHADNSPLYTLIEGQSEKYTRVDALTMDKAGNLWMINCGPKESLTVLTQQHEWHRFPSPNVFFKVNKDLFIDKDNPNIKIAISTYNVPGIMTYDDNGTWNNIHDDKSTFCTSFVDEDGNTLTPDYLFCAAHDHDGCLWVGTKAGVIKFNKPSNLLKSNACSRIKIARQDGSGLADYLLNDEQINAIAVDGANRIWFGTEESGVYLMDVSDPQNIITVQHYTTDNSPLPSNTIISIAINPITGEVFFGTGGGLVSYQSDAAEGKEDYSSAYAYPNPVRRDFQGVITIAGLMTDTKVSITDNGGNLVYETQSNGGVAIWDGRNGKGERVSTGVYFAMCVTADGTNNALVKILVIN